MRSLISFLLLSGLCLSALPNEASARDRHRRLYFSSQPPIFFFPPQPPPFLYESPEEYDPYVEGYVEPYDPQPPRQKRGFKKNHQKQSSVKKSGSDARALSKASSAPVNAAVSCEKAGDIVRDFGFQSVKSASCNGKIYAFKAMRDGKLFSVKLDSGNGELTEVKKQP